ncbi:MAG: hotdog fold thioesterase [Bacteroidota bacterium]
MRSPTDIALAELNATSQGNMVGFLGIEYTAIDADYLAAKMPVSQKTQQPIGWLHGGASVVLAETIGSMAANLAVDRAQYYCVGLSIHANHMRRVTQGYVYAVATPLHTGKSTQVWQIKITDEQKQLVCASQLTVKVLDKR